MSNRVHSASAVIFAGIFAVACAPPTSGTDDSGAAEATDSGPEDEEEFGDEWPRMTGAPTIEPAIAPPGGYVDVTVPITANTTAATVALFGTAVTAGGAAQNLVDQTSVTMRMMISQDPPAGEYALKINLCADVCSGYMTSYDESSASTTNFSVKFRTVSNGPFSDPVDSGIPLVRLVVE